MAYFVKKENEVVYSIASSGTAVSSGAVVVLGSNICGVATRDIPAGGSGVVSLEGVWCFPVSSVTANIGAKAYWDATNAAVTTTATNNTYLGVFVTSPTSQTSALICLNR